MIKDADAGGNAIAEFHGQRHETRDDLRRSIRHLLGEVLHRLLLAQIVRRRGRTAQQLIRDNHGGNRVGGAIRLCHAASACYNN